MRNFKTKDLMIAISPEKSDHADVYNCENKSKRDVGGTNCTNCTHNTATTCIPHSKKPPKKPKLKDSMKAAELSRLRKSIAKLQEKEYA
jgi:hypothetical protein